MSFLILAVAALGLSAQTLPAKSASRPVTNGPAMESLTAVASGEKTGDELFDGMPVLRQEGSLVILTEQKDILLDRKDYPARTRRIGGGRANDGMADTVDEPAKTVYSYGDRQTVGIKERGAYVREQAGEGAKWGGIVGGILGLILGIVLGVVTANPWIGIGVGLGVAAGGAALGAGIGAIVGAAKPRVFTRDNVKSTKTVTY